MFTACQIVWGKVKAKAKTGVCLCNKHDILHDISTDSENISDQKNQSGLLECRK